MIYELYLNTNKQKITINNRFFNRLHICDIFDKQSRKTYRHHLHKRRKLQLIKKKLETYLLVKKKMYLIFSFYCFKVKSLVVNPRCLSVNIFTYKIVPLETQVFKHKVKFNIKLFQQYHLPFPKRLLSTLSLGKSNVQKLWSLQTIV